MHLEAHHGLWEVIIGAKTNLKKDLHARLMILNSVFRVSELPIGCLENGKRKLGAHSSTT